jgi:hypothetical protein
MRVFRRLSVAGAALALALASASPVVAAMAVIETAAQLNEHSNEGVKAAVLKAVETAARGAKAMGLSQITVKGVRVLPEMVVVQVLATDSAPGSEPDGEDQDGDTGPPVSGEGTGVQERL